MPQRTNRGNRQQKTFTLPDGRIIELPSFETSIDPPPSPYSTINPRDEFDTCCWPEDSPNSSGNYTYPQADWCYSESIPLGNYLFIIGTIFIDDEPSENPLHCTGDETDTYENCMGSFAYRGPPPQSDCDISCETNDDCPTLPFPEASICKHYTGSCNIDGKYCGYVNDYPWPNYGLYSYKTPTGNADAIAVMFEGSIIGFDFINNISMGDVPIEGITIPYYHRQGQLTLDCYPSIGDTIDDLILYRASTGTYHALDDESHDIFLDSLMPIVGYGDFSIIEADLNFGILKPGPSEPDCHDCLQYNNSATPWVGCMENDNLGCSYITTGENVCWCAHPYMGCCETGDVNQDLLINVQDVLILVDSILTYSEQNAPDTHMPASEMPLADINGDGWIDVVDVFNLVQMILNDPSTTSAEQQQLQGALNRLNASQRTNRGDRQNEKQILINRILRKQGSGR